MKNGKLWEKKTCFPVFASLEPHHTAGHWPLPEKLCDEKDPLKTIAQAAGLIWHD
jgi:hypothetical protein